MSLKSITDAIKQLVGAAVLLGMHSEAEVETDNGKPQYTGAIKFQAQAPIEVIARADKEMMETLKRNAVSFTIGPDDEPQEFRTYYTILMRRVNFFARQNHSEGPTFGELRRRGSKAVVSAPIMEEMTFDGQYVDLVKTIKYFAPKDPAKREKYLEQVEASYAMLEDAVSALPESAWKDVLKGALNRQILEDIVDDRERR